MGPASTLSRKAAVMVDNHETISEYLTKVQQIDNIKISFLKSGEAALYRIAKRLY